MRSVRSARIPIIWPNHRTKAELGEALKAMSDLDYVRPDEVATIPVIEREVRHVVYGPLADFPSGPMS